MATAYTLVEPACRGYVPIYPFGLNASGTAIHEIMRLLTGSVNLRANDSGKILHLNWDEVQRKNCRNAKPEKIRDLIFGSEMNIEDYKNLIIKASSENNVFFIHLLKELTLCLAAKKIKRFTECFLYLYRILEYTSIAFPMLYAVSETDFRRSHSFLQSLLQAEKDGDLKVLERALPVIGQESALHHINFDFSVDGYELSFAENLKSQITPMIESNKLLRSTVILEEDGEILLRVPFNSMSSFLATIRNRMFHYRTKENNFQLSSLGGSEQLCRLIVSEGIYWFAILFSEIVKTLSRR